ncbi:MAG: hypothetical protein WDM76_01405 [Limisphaerales bacterium]
MFHPPVITSCRLTGGDVVVGFTTSGMGYSYFVQALDSSLTVRQSQQVITSAPSATASFDPASLPNPVFFRVVLQ